MSRAPKLALAVLALLPATAGAETRYATPDPVGEPDCSQGAPCSLQQALEFAQDGDDVLLAAGQYAGPFSNAKPITIHAAPPTRPTITGYAEPAFLLSGGTLADVALVQEVSGTAAVVSGTGVLDRVIARADAGESIAVTLQDGARVRNSAALAAGDGGQAISVESAPNGVQVANVTATGASDGLVAGEGASATVVNSILRGV